MRLAGTNTAATLPYQQGAGGSTNIPTSPRLIILSSTSSALPAGISNGVPASTNFNALWNNPDNTIPTGTSWNWSTWKGTGYDLKIQRINLASSFNHLVLTVLDATNAPYNIDEFGLAFVTNSTSTTSNSMDAYFLKGTVFKLYSNTTNLQAAQVLQTDLNYVFSGGLWRLAPVPASGTAGSSPSVSSSPSVAVANTDNCSSTCDGSWGNLGCMCHRFCTNCPNQETCTRCCDVACDLANYMNLYLQYAAGNFSSWSICSRLQATNTILCSRLDSLCTHW